MLRSWIFLAVLAALVPFTLRADSEIAISIRYLQAQGVSHAQIFLYREDGTLLRQLTNEKTGQMRGPLFAQDGGTIVFTRVMPNGQKDYWSVEPKGGNLKKLDAAPDWYTAAKGSPYFSNEESPAAANAPAPSPVLDSAGDQLVAPPGPDHYTTPDGAQEILLRVSGSNDQFDEPGRGANYQLVDTKSGASVEMGTLPGFLGLFELLHLGDDPSNVFLMTPPLRLAFFDLHLDSTDGDTDFALDLTGKRLVQLSPNWAAPVPLPGQPAFLTFTSVRYVPIAGSKMTANSSYLEDWDANLNKIRYARDGAAICYGASMYRPGMDPVTVDILDPNE